MTRREVAALCCRMVALFFLAWGMSQLVLLVPALTSAIRDSVQFERTATTMFTPQVTMYGSMSCSLLLVTMGLAWKAEAISCLMASDDSTPVTGPEFSAAALMPVACAGVGLYAVTRALLTFIQLGVFLVFTDSTIYDYWDDSQWRSRLLSEALMVGWGIWLTFGSRGLIRLITWTRSVHSADATSAAGADASEARPPRTPEVAG